MDIYNIKQLEYCTEKPTGRKATDCSTPEKLQEFLINQGLNIQLLLPLKGGVDSQVYSAKLDEKNVVVKHTEDRSQSVYNPPFSEIDFFVDRENHNMDTKVLKKLSKSTVRVPEVIRHFPEVTTTIMEDLKDSGYELMLTMIVNNNLSLDTAFSMGDKLAELALISKEWESFECYKNPYIQFFERGLELRLAFPNTQKEFTELKEAFTNKKRYWMWPDSHPKNIFINNKTGEVAFIDFGGSYWGDQNFMLPNFIGQFLIYVTGGYISVEFALGYIEKIISAYSNKISIDETLLCKYVGMEVLHRAYGKWVEGVNNSNHKIKNIKLGLMIFENHIVTIDGLFKLIKEVCND
jgi:hypothetical protein